MTSTQAFLFVSGVGGAVCAAAWFSGMKVIQRSSGWRALFCILVAATITPTCFRFWGDLVFYPAALVLLVILDGGKDAVFAFWIAAVPILMVAAVMFWTWQAIIHWGQRHDSHRS